VRLSSTSPRALALALAALTFVAFLPSLGGDFLLDDNNTIVHNSALKKPARWLWAFYDSTVLTADDNQTSMMYRPLTAWSFAINRHLTGVTPWGFHLTSILLHATNAALLFLLLHEFFGKRGRWAALCGALFFALHPAQVEAVAYISGSRATLLSLLFCLLALRAYAAKQIEWAWGFFCAALFCKESAVLLLALLPAYDWVFRPRQKGKKRWQDLGGFVVIFAGYLFLRWNVLGVFAQRGLWGGTGALHAQMAVHGLFQDVKIMLLPTDLRACYSFPLDAWLLQGSVLKGMLLCFLAGATAWALKKRSPLGFGMLWAAAALAPVSNIVPVEALAADRFAYPALVGVAVALAWAISDWGAKRTQLLAAAVVLICGFASLRGQLRFKDQLSLDAAAYAVAPEDPCTGLNLATHAYNAGRYNEAESLLKRPLQKDAPVHIRGSALFISGMTAFYQGQLPVAEKRLQQSLELRDNAWVRGVLRHLRTTSGN
jgi:hypothetical protein